VNVPGGQEGDPSMKVFWILSFGGPFRGYYPLEGFAKDTILWKGQKILVVLVQIA